jgi:AcrR family transcriptional regulator
MTVTARQDRPNTTTRPLRADSARKRQAMLEAAAAAFAERGLEASLDEIAARAGVGVGTAYRHFSNKNGLIEALFEAVIDEIAQAAETALTIEDPWLALTTFIEDALQHQIANRGLRQILTADRGLPGLHRARARIAPLVTRLVRRAQRAGVVRRDLASTDVPPLLFMITIGADIAGPAHPDHWRRYHQILLDGIRPHPAQPKLAPAPLTDDQLDQALLDWDPPR